MHSDTNSVAVAESQAHAPTADNGQLDALLTVCQMLQGACIPAPGLGCVPWQSVNCVLSNGTLPANFKLVNTTGGAVSLQDCAPCLRPDCTALLLPMALGCSCKLAGLLTADQGH